MCVDTYFVIEQTQEAYLHTRTYIHTSWLCTKLIRTAAKTVIKQSKRYIRTVANALGTDDYGRTNGCKPNNKSSTCCTYVCMYMSRRDSTNCKYTKQIYNRAYISTFVTGSKVHIRSKLTHCTYFVLPNALTISLHLAQLLSFIGFYGRVFCIYVRMYAYAYAHA